MNTLDPSCIINLAFLHTKIYLFPTSRTEIFIAFLYWDAEKRKDTLPRLVISYPAPSDEMLSNSRRINVRG